MGNVGDIIMMTARSLEKPIGAGEYLPFRCLRQFSLPWRKSVYYIQSGVEFSQASRLLTTEIDAAIQLQM